MSDVLPKAKEYIVQLLIVVALVIGGLFVFQFLSYMIVFFVSGMEMQPFLNEMSSPMGNPDFKGYILFIQLLSSLGAFILVPMYFIHHFEKRKVFSDFSGHNLTLTSVLITIGLTLSFIVADSIVIEWNMGVQFPEPFQTWASQKEDLMKHMTEYLTDFDSLGYFLVSFLAIAIIPAVGEELLFRGLIQKYLWVMTKNPHVAIWLTAFFFSAFHLQFFGFLPRMLLGALFGYLYYFSGNLIYAIIGHFVNNGFTIIMLYMYQLELVEYDIENTESIPLETVGIFTIIGVGLFMVYIKQFKERLSYE